MVGVGREDLDGEGVGAPDLGGDQEAGGGEQLELLLLYGADAEEAVHAVHGQREDLLLAPLLFAHLKEKFRG